MRITARRLRRIIREERRKLFEDALDTELDHLKKNVDDDLEHIRDLKDDIEDDHDEEVRAEKEKRKDESVRLTRKSLQRIIRTEVRRFRN